MSTHANMVKMTTETTGTGTITLGSASSGFQSFADAYGANATVDVLITDGTAWEVARNCTYTHSGTTLTRGTLEDSSTGAALNLTGAAVVSVVATAAFGNATENVVSNGGLVYVESDGSTSETLTNNAWNRLTTTLATETTDERGWWDHANQKFQPTVAGKYLISYLVTVGLSSTLATGSVRVFSGIYKNGSLFTRGNRHEFFYTAAALSVGPGSECITVVSLNGSSDYIEPYVFAAITTGTVTATTSGLAGAARFQARYLGE